MTSTQTLPLSEQHYEHLKKSAISDEIIEERGYHSVTTSDEFRELDGYRMSVDQLRVVPFPGIAFPNYRLGSQKDTVWVLRPDRPRKPRGSDRDIKYEWPVGVPTAIDVLPRFSEELKNPNIPLWITEGSKKSDAMASQMAGVVPVSLNGVWGWITRNQHGGKLINAELHEVAWNDREVVLAFDSDIIEKPAVKQALMALAAQLEPKGALLKVLYLPNDDTGKTGIDDALAAGMSPEQIKALVHPWLGQPKRGGTKLHTNFGQGITLELPSNYEFEADTLSKQIGDKWTPIYNGPITIASTSVDVAEGDELMTVVFLGADNKPTTVTAPRAELCRSKGVMDRLAAGGAAVHEGNAKDLAIYLTELANKNVDVLPRTKHTSKLGLVHGGIALPGRSVATLSEVVYTGRVEARECQDKDVYVNAIREALTWNTYSLWLVLALSLASPIIARMRPVRNPATYIAGPSGSGKTTATKFALAAWAFPHGAPFVIQAPRTTMAGFYQNLEHANGLPVLIDEAHEGRAEHLQSVAYNFANGESYAKGGADGNAQGSKKLHGTLLLSGEAMLEWKNAGSNNRIIWIDNAEYPLLGAQAETELGAKRAMALERAWQDGFGVVGPKVVEAIWGRWDEFTADVKAFRTILNEENAEMTKLSAWSESLSIALTTLNWAFEVLGIDDDAVHGLMHELPGQVIKMLSGSRQRQDPAVAAWDGLKLMMASASTVENTGTGTGWKVKEFRGEPVAYLKSGETEWRIPTGTKQFKDYVGDTAAQMYGQKWVKDGLVVPYKDGSSTGTRKVLGGFSIKSVLVPAAALQAGEDE